MSIRIALAGNPNCGKTTLFNALTGSNQFVGNWPGVTVEKKEGKLKRHEQVTITDLPGIYSLSPYTLEEVVARNYLIDERPDVVINLVDGTNMERNLYLTTQVLELGIPTLVAVNMMDIVEKNGDKLNLEALSEILGCKVMPVSALKGDGVMEAAEAAVSLAGEKPHAPRHKFAGPVEHALAHIEEVTVHDLPKEQQHFFAIKLFERDQKMQERLRLRQDVLAHIEEDIRDCEREMDDDAESIITNERYLYIASIIQDVAQKNKARELTTSDRIDRVVTNRLLALPIFALVMFIVYYVSVTTVGGRATDWANDGLFGDGFYLFGNGRAAYEEAAEAFGGAAEIVEVFEGAEGEDRITYIAEDEETLEPVEVEVTREDLAEAEAVLARFNGEEPDPAEYGTWIPGVPAVIEGVLDSVNCADWLKGLILDGIVAGVGAVLGFVPQMLVLFLFLAFLEACGYMARVAFIMDRIFRRFGLSGKSFIPILIGTGCGIPGIMASRTIENERDRRMTVITTTFIPCGAKLPFIAMVAGALFGGAAWVAPTAYFMGIGAIICSGIILKKTKVFAGDPAPFVMELPAYHMPTLGAVLRGMWERGWSFIKKAGTIILLSTIVIWFLTFFGMEGGSIVMLEEDQVDASFLASVGNALAWIFIPLGFGNWQATVASITGLVAKENIVGTMGILYSLGDGTTWQNMAAAFAPYGIAASGLAFLAFNLLCAPCFAAMGAIKREMNSAKWFWIAIGYQCGLAWLVGLVVYQLGGLIMGTTPFNLFTVIALVAVAAFLYLLFRPQKNITVQERVVRA